MSAAAADGWPSPAAVLPHRAPFLFLDEVTALEPGVRAAGTWRPGRGEAFFDGHFPGRPTLPGVLMVEAIAQLGAYALLTGEEPTEGRTRRLPLFGGVDRVRFRHQVGPGDLLELEVELGRRSGRGGRGRGRASVGGQVACDADLLFVLVDATATELR